MSSQDHHTRIADCIAAKYRAQRWRFRHNLDRAIAGTGIDHYGLPEIPNVIPDVHLIQQNGIDLRLTCWEVTVSNPLSHQKLMKYAWFWAELWACDLEIYFQLREVDRYGAEATMDLMPYYVEGLTGDPAASLAFVQASTLVPPPPWEILNG